MAEGITISHDENSEPREEGVELLPPQEAEMLREFAEGIAISKRWAKVSVIGRFGDGTLLVSWSHDQWQRGVRGLIRKVGSSFSYCEEEPIAR